MDDKTGDDEFKEFLEKGQTNIQLPILMFIKNKSEYVLKSCDMLIKSCQITELDEDIKKKLKETLIKMLDQVSQTSFQYDYSVMDMEEGDDEEDGEDYEEEKNL